jgi:hypothetical protein
VITNLLGIYTRQRNFVLLHSKPNCLVSFLKPCGDRQAIAQPYQECIEN